MPSPSLLSSIYDHADFPRDLFRLGGTSFSGEAQVLTTADCPHAPGGHTRTGLPLTTDGCDCVDECAPESECFPLAHVLAAATALDSLTSVVTRAVEHCQLLAPHPQVVSSLRNYTNSLRDSAFALHDWEMVSKYRWPLDAMRESADTPGRPAWAQQMVEDHFAHLKHSFTQATDTIPWADLWAAVTNTPPDPAQSIVAVPRDSVMDVFFNPAPAPEVLMKTMLACSPVVTTAADWAAYVLPSACVEHLPKISVHAPYRPTPDAALAVALVGTTNGGYLARFGDMLDAACAATS